MQEDTTTQAPFFSAAKFHSSGYAGFEAMGGQLLTSKGAMLTGLSLNWVVNKKYVVSAKYHVLGSRNNIDYIVGRANPVYLVHHYAGLGFGYILFHDKLFSFHPELTAGWAVAKYATSGDNFTRRDYAMLVPNLQAVWNATRFFRIGVGLNYRLAIGKELNGFRASQLSGASGVVFMRVGKF